MRAHISQWILGPVLALSAAPSTGQNFEIAEFTAQPPTLVQGQSSVLRWRVFGQAREIMIVHNRDWPPVKYVDRVGEMSVSPLETTIYSLYVKDGAEKKTQSITIVVWPAKRPPTTIPPTSVPPTIGYCTVFGHVNFDQPKYGTKAYLINPLTRATVGPIEVDPRGDYNRSNVEPGNYNVTLRGSFPSSGDYRDAIGPVPPQRRITCLPGGRHQADFYIGGLEG